MGIPYAHHPLHLAEQMDDEDSTIVALLHDVVEDTNYTLYEKDFLNGIIASVNHDGDCVEAFDTRPADIRYGLEGLNR